MQEDMLVPYPPCQRTNEKQRGKFRSKIKFVEYWSFLLKEIKFISLIHVINFALM